MFCSKKFPPDCQEVLDKTDLHVIFRFYVQVFKIQFSSPKDMNIQIVFGECLKIVFAQ